MVHNLFSYPNHFMVTVNPSSNQFTEDAYQPRVVCTVLIFMKPKRCCTSVVGTVPPLIGVEKKA